MKDGAGEGGTNMRKRAGRQAGNSIVEFVLVGIPTIFIVLSVFEMARGMWEYHTLSEAIKHGARYCIVKGENCLQPGNSCSVTVGAIASRISGYAVGMPSNDLNVTLISNSGSIACNPIASCFSNTTRWPPDGDNSTNMDIKILGSYSYVSMLAMFWPGQSSQRFGTFTFSTYTRQTINF